MKVVIQCADTKSPHAGRLQTVDDRPVLFVADPGRAPTHPDIFYARPDDEARPGSTWRDLLLKYNEAPAANSLGLLPAFQLYENKAYGRLVQHFGLNKVLILSAGWGLVTADFLLPDYDLSLNPRVAPYKCRRKSDVFLDLSMIADEPEEIVFLGSKAYVPLFCALTAHVAARKFVFYNTSVKPQLPVGYIAIRYPTRARTNWQYLCARDLIEERIEVDCRPISHL